MVSLWNILGTAVIVLGFIASFFQDGVGMIIPSIISSIIAGIVCYTISHVIESIDSIRDQLSAGASGPAVKSTETPSAPSKPAPSYTAKASGEQAPKTWTCKKCLASNPATAQYCKECGTYK